MRERGEGGERGRKGREGETEGSASGGETEPTNTLSVRYRIRTPTSARRGGEYLKGAQDCKWGLEWGLGGRLDMSHAAS